MNKQKQNHAIKYTVVALIALQIVTLTWLVTLQVALNTRDLGYESNLIKSWNREAEMRFCLDNQIRPCDHTAIEEWNTKNPDNTFELTGVR